VPKIGLKIERPWMPMGIVVLYRFGIQRRHSFVFLSAMVIQEVGLA